MKPNFIVIGSQAVYTKQLYGYLVKHPLIATSYQEDIRFFDKYYTNGFDWYLKQFPYLSMNKKCEDIITGEASSYYFYYPHAPKRIKTMLPDIKIVILLQKPIVRAFAQHFFNQKDNIELLNFNEGMMKEKLRLSGEIEKMMTDENYYSFNHEKFTYLEAGVYIKFINHWLKYFSPHQIYVLFNDGLYQNPTGTFESLFRFLNVEHVDIDTSNLKEVVDISQLNRPIVETLNRFYQPYNQQLMKVLKGE